MKDYIKLKTMKKTLLDLLKAAVIYILITVLAALFFMSLTSGCALKPNRGYHKMVRTHHGIIYPAQKDWINTVKPCKLKNR